MVKNNSIEIISNPDLPNLYRLMNMNDMLTSFITLFAILVVNNFQVVVEVFTTVMDSPYPIWFFVAFYFLSVVVLVEIVVALVIDMYGHISELA